MGGPGRSRQTRQRTKAPHGGPRGLLHPLPLRSRRGGLIGVDSLDWTAAAAGFDMIQNHVDLLSGKAHPVPTRSTATAMDAEATIRDMCLRPVAEFPDSDVLAVDHDARLTSEATEAFHAFVKSIGSCLLVDSIYRDHKTPSPRWSGPPASSAARCGPAQTDGGRKVDWASRLALAESAINNIAPTLGDNPTPFFIDRSAGPRLPLSPPHDDRAASESPAHFAQRMRDLGATVRPVRELLAAAQAERKAKLNAGRVDTVFRVGDQVLLRTKELLDAADIGKLRPRWDGLPFRVTVTTRCPPTSPCRARCAAARGCPTANVDSLKPFFRVARAGTPPVPGPVSGGAGGRARGGAAAQPPGGARRDALPGALAGPHVG